MSIRNVESTLPDRDWVDAVEKELRDLRELVERLRLDVVQAGR